MKVYNLHKPVEITQIPQDLPGEAYNIIKKEINSGNELQYLVTRNELPDKIVVEAAFICSFSNIYGKIYFEKGSRNGYKEAFICEDDRGMTIIYAGKVTPNKCQI